MAQSKTTHSGTSQFFVPKSTYSGFPVVSAVILSNRGRVMISYPWRAISKSSVPLSACAGAAQRASSVQARAAWRSYPQVREDVVVDSAQPSFPAHHPVETA